MADWLWLILIDTLGHDQEHPRTSKNIQEHPRTSLATVGISGSCLALAYIYIYTVYLYSISIQIYTVYKYIILYHISTIYDSLSFYIYIYAIPYIIIKYPHAINISAPHLSNVGLHLLLGGKLISWRKKQVIWPLGYSIVPKRNVARAARLIAMSYSTNQLVWRYNIYQASSLFLIPWYKCRKAIWPYYVDGLNRAFVDGLFGLQ